MCSLLVTMCSSRSITKCDYSSVKMVGYFAFQTASCVMEGTEDYPLMEI